MADDAGTVVKTKPTTVAQDRAWLKWMVDVRDETEDIYDLFGEANCRTYAQREFDDAPGNH